MILSNNNIIILYIIINHNYYIVESSTLVTALWSKTLMYVRSRAVDLGKNSVFFGRSFPHRFRYTAVLLIIITITPARFVSRIFAHKSIYMLYFTYMLVFNVHMSLRFIIAIERRSL